MSKVSFITLNGDKYIDDIFTNDKNILYNYLVDILRNNIYNITDDFVIIRLFINNIELNNGIHDIDIDKLPNIIDNIIITIIKHKPNFKINALNFSYLLSGLFDENYIIEKKNIFKKYFSEDIIAMSLLLSYPNLIICCSNSLRDNNNILLNIINNNYKGINNFVIFFRSISNRLKNDYNFILEVVKKDGLIFPELNDNFKKDKKIIFNALSNNKYILSYLDQILYKDFILDFIDYKLIDYDFLNEIFKSDKDIIFKLIKQEPEIYKYIIDELKNDKDIILEIINKNSSLLKYATDSFYNTYMNKIKIFI